MMIPTRHYAGERVVVMGLGKSGLSAAESLRASGADVRVWDDHPAQLAKVITNGFTAFDGARPDFSGIRALVWSPGVPHTFPKPPPIAERARAANVALSCDVDLLLESQPNAEVVGITGTNGKSTTTELIANLFRCAGRKVAVGGNLGTPALHLEPLGLGGTYVLELSSYQLELVPHLSCATAVLLNISPDHLDRHGGMEGYIAAKRRIFESQRSPRTAIISIDDDISATLCTELIADGVHNVIPISGRQSISGGVYVEKRLLIESTSSQPITLMDLKTAPTLSGIHNWQNAAAATAVALSHGITTDVIVSGICKFPGLKHRQELVATVGNTVFINDSKATNVVAAEKALLCYENIYWIAGGRAKDSSIDSLNPVFPRIRQAFLVGESAAKFTDHLEGHVPYTLYEDLKAAVKAAGQAALSDKNPATVLLSPACASFDMFENFEKRGDCFRNEVLSLWPPEKVQS